ncbi:MAG: LysR family transcriptional regulator, partial [Myxococcales bacterium]|nr:LysR family transcriptional regulator [Myxococcales bacterium]
MEGLDWDALRVFLAVERAGSLTGAASRLGVSVATVSRRIERLEEDLGRKLFQRHASGLTLMSDAEELLERAKGVQEQVFDFLRLAEAEGSEELAGTVTITTIDTIITRVLVPTLGEFRARYPRINLVLRASSRVVNLTSRAADIALRVMRPQESHIVAQKVATIHFSLYASPSYIARRGRPLEPWRDLSGHDLVTYDRRYDTIPEVAWLHQRASEEDLAIRLTSAEAIAAAVEAGAGIGVLPSFMAGEKLVCLWEGQDLPEREVWLAVHEDLRDVPRVRAVFGFLREVILQAASLQEGKREGARQREDEEN